MTSVLSAHVFLCDISLDLVYEGIAVLWNQVEAYGYASLETYAHMITYADGS